jgi:hypothetical protein
MVQVGLAPHGIRHDGERHPLGHPEVKPGPRRRATTLPPRRLRIAEGAAEVRELFGGRYWT